MNSNQTRTFRTKASQGRWYVASIVLLVFAFSLYQLWIVWPSLLIESISWQQEVNAQLADLLYEAKNNSLEASIYLVGASFLYGMLHSLGPGHGKVIVTTYLATHSTKVKTSLILTFVSAICQALVAIVLVSVLLWGFNASMQTVNYKAMFFVSLSFFLVSVFGGFICCKAIKNIYRSIYPSKLAVTTLIPMPTDPLDSVKQMPSKPPLYASILARGSNAEPFKNQHVHHSDCGCGHQHVVNADTINKASTWSEYAGIIATIGVRPCTGAIMVLLFSNMVDLYWMGAVSAVVMAVGTALTTSLIAIMTLTGKHLVKRYLVRANKNNRAGWKLASYFLQLSGGLLLMIFGLLFISSQDLGISPMFSV